MYNKYSNIKINILETERKNSLQRAAAINICVVIGITQLDNTAVYIVAPSV